MAVACSGEDSIDGNSSEGGGEMMRVSIPGLGVLCTALAWALVSPAIAGTASKATVQPYEGQIKSIKVDKCGLQPGSCEGSVVLARAGGGGEVTLALKPGSWIKRGTELVTIDELSIGNQVKVEAVQLPGQELQQITIMDTEGT
jgi:hypothetical protein